MNGASAYVCAGLSDSEAAAILEAVRLLARQHVAAAAVRDDADPYSDADPFADLPTEDGGHL